MSVLAASWMVAALYLVLLVWPLPLRGQLQLQDLLLPVMGILLLLRGETVVSVWKRWRLLCVFCALVTLSTLVHGPLEAASWYEWLIYALYMPVLFCFVSGLELPPRCCGYLALALFAVVVTAMAAELLLLPPGTFSYLSAGMKETALPFLARRFAFTFDNPNLFATFFVIPCALAVRWAALAGTQADVRFRIVLPLLLALVCVPLLWSASKHALMSCVLLALTAYHAWPWQAWRRWLFGLIVCGLLLGAVVGETTVLCVTFPLSARGIHTQRGMYTIHQAAYANMLREHPGGALLGLGPSRCRQLYPACVDSQQARQTLEFYHAGHQFKTFTTYMDPHNEWLNLATLFGLPALLLMVCFWLALWRQAPAPLVSTTLLFAGAVLACCLWDDLLSKRHIWLAAAILIAPYHPRDLTHESHLPRP